MVVCSAALGFRGCRARRGASPGHGIQNERARTPSPILYPARKSVLLCMLFHASVNAVTSGYVFQLFADADQSRLWWIYALVWVAGAAAIAWRSGPALRSSARS